MNQFVQYVLQRARETVAVIGAIAGEWVWGEHTAAEFTTKINALEAKVSTEAGEGAEADLERGTIDAQLDALHEKTRTFLTFAKTRHRNTPDKLRAYKPLQAVADSRAAILRSAKLFEAAWSKVDPAWEPEAGETAAGYLAQLNAAEDELRDLAKEHTDETVARGSTDELAKELNDWNVAWYADATAKFAATTPFGMVIRSDIHTSYVPPADPPGACGFTHIESAAPGEATAGLSAPGATHYKLWHMGPSDTEWVLVLDDSDSGEYSETGLEAGEHRYKGQGFNSGGGGPESEEQTVTVA